MTKSATLVSEFQTSPFKGQVLRTFITYDGGVAVSVNLLRLTDEQLRYLTDRKDFVAIYYAGGHYNLVFSK